MESNSQMEQMSRKEAEVRVKPALEKFGSEQ
jgi:hypothetical protein